MIKKTLLLLTIVLALVSCNGDRSSDNKIIISGQIIKPSGESVLLSHTVGKNDTIHLDEDGFFKYSCDQLREGLYNIRHGELQYMYLEPGDSIVFRVNTLEFDESLAFSGKGAAKNNFLINQFLKNEEFNTMLPEHFKLNPKEFEKVISAQKEQNNIDLKRFIEKNHLSEGFLTIAQANIDYNFYSQKELYTASYNSSDEAQEINYTEDFYTYRNTIDFNNKALSNYYAYYSFLNRYFDNVAYDSYKKHTNYNRESFVHNKIKLNLIDTNIENEDLHNNMLTSTVRRYLLNADNSENEQKIITLYNTLDRDTSDQGYIKQYAENSAKINAGNKIPNLMLVNLSNESVMLSELKKQLTVLYFWSGKNIKHVKEIHSRVAELKSKFPEYNFIGINTDNNFKDWKKIVLNSGYNDTSEYQFENTERATKELLINSSNKALITDKNGIILEGNSHIFNQNFESRLLGFLNK